MGAPVLTFPLYRLRRVGRRWVGLRKATASLRCGAAAAWGCCPPRGSASCSNMRARYIHVPLGQHPHAAASFAGVGIGASWCKRRGDRTCVRGKASATGCRQIARTLGSFSANAPGRPAGCCHRSGNHDAGEGRRCLGRPLAACSEQRVARGQGPTQAAAAPHRSEAAHEPPKRRRPLPKPMLLSSQRRPPSDGEASLRPCSRRLRWHTGQPNRKSDA